MKKRTTAILLCLFFIPIVCISQRTSILPMGNGIYLASQSGKTDFANKEKIKQRVLEDVKSNAKSKNADYEIISINSGGGGFAGLPKVDIRFRLIKNSKELANPNAINISKTKDEYGNTDYQIQKNDESDIEKYKKLEKLGKLLKDGIITKEEFDKEKKKILN